MDAYINAVSSFLPGEAVDNDGIGSYLGATERTAARTQRMILASNGIGKRHYAIDPQTGMPTHTNAQLAAAAVRGLHHEIAAEDIECLCCGTSSPDQLMPGHASMVHGELAGRACDLIITAGICLSGITAMKYGAMNVALGLTKNAVATGSELASSYMREDFFNRTASQKSAAEKEHTQPAFSFEENFLRWMLSDGAGAALIEQQPRAPISLRIEWIEISSLAHRLEPCMYAGCLKSEEGIVTGWRERVRQGEGLASGMFTVKQDAKLLNREVIPALVGDVLPKIMDRHGLAAADIDWFLPHYSSEFFREPLSCELQKINFAIPSERWFTNLSTRGNTGSASFYIMLEELFHSGRLQKGQRILGFVPESGRFAVGYLLLTVV